MHISKIEAHIGRKVEWLHISNAPTKVTGGFRHSVVIYSVAKKGKMTRIGVVDECTYEGDNLQEEVVPRDLPRLAIHTRFWGMNTTREDSWQFYDQVSPSREQLEAAWAAKKKAQMEDCLKYHRDAHASREVRAAEIRKQLIKEAELCKAQPGLGFKELDRLNAEYDLFKKPF